MISPIGVLWGTGISSVPAVFPAFTDAHLQIFVVVVCLLLL